MSEVFDLEAFENQQTTEAGSTSLSPIPAGEYLAIIDSAKLRSVTTKNGPSVMCDVTYLLQSPETAAKLKREKLSVRQSFFIDFTADGKHFDMSEGRNTGLNKVRKAVGMNDPGKPFAISMLAGKGPVKVQVTLRPDKNDSDVIYNDVKSVGKA